MAKRIQRTIARPRAQRPAAGAGAGGAGAAARDGAQRRAKPTGRRVAGQAVTEFTIQLATLSAAGIPIVRALSILEGQTKPGPFKAVLQELVEDVSAGTPLSEAMGKHGRTFDRLYASMVRAGEAGGILDVVLERLAQFREKAAEIRAKVVGAMIYPLVIVLVAVTVVSIVIVWVIPRFEEIFESFDVTLPGLTQLLLNVSRTAVQYWYLVFGVPLLLLFSHVVLMRRTGYRYRVHRLLLRLPVIGSVISRSIIADFSRTFGTLIQAGVPHLDALAIVRDTTGNEVLLEAVEDVRRTVREGEGISSPMRESGVFDEIVVNMVDVGEQTGELDNMLLRVADNYEKQLDRRINNMFKVLEPALLILMAIFVGFIVVALFVPLLKIMSSLSDL